MRRALAYLAGVLVLTTAATSCAQLGAIGDSICAKLTEYCAAAP